jgi:phosphoribosyl 1,2-cyclic phosphodiesterase
MVRVTILASGSKGNCTVVSTSKTRIMLDAGLSCREIVKRMRFAKEEPEKLDAILITHEHQDHIQGLSAMARRWSVPVFATEATHTAWKRWMMPRRTMSFAAWLEMRRQQPSGPATSAGAEIGPAVQDLTEASLELPGLAAEGASGTAGSGVPLASETIALEEELLTPAGDDPACLPAVEFFRAGTPFEVGDIRVTPFTVPHDAVDPVGFVLEAEGMRMAVATDLGYMPPNVKTHLRRADLLVIESNHDVEMLRDGPYPWAVKQRVLSRVGHLSNDAVGEYLSKEYDGWARFVVLAHLSASNNLPELARISAERALADRMGLLANSVLLASQNAPLESIYL